MAEDGVISPVTTRGRALWLVGIMFVIFVFLVFGGILRIQYIQHQQDRDMCQLLDVLLPDTTAPDGDAPGPTSPYGQAQRRAIADYRAHRC